MGVVYLGVSPSGRHVALKVIRQEYAADPLFRARFAREVAAARLVSGAFTASVVDADAEAEVPWLATQFIDAPALSERVSREGPLAPDALWTLAYGLAEALRDIHRAGVVHRDLKPGNILMADDGPRVIDFGISRDRDAADLGADDRAAGIVQQAARRPRPAAEPEAVDLGAAAFPVLARKAALPAAAVVIAFVLVRLLHRRGPRS